RIVPRSIGYVASKASRTARCVAWPSKSSCTSPLTRASVRKCVGKTTRIMVVSALRLIGLREDLERSESSYHRRQLMRKPDHLSFQNRCHMDQANRSTSRRVARSRSNYAEADPWLAFPIHCLRFDCDRHVAFRLEESARNHFGSEPHKSFPARARARRSENRNRSASYR